LPRFPFFPVRFFSNPKDRLVHFSHL
jgi:hypothetical protein